MLGSNQQYQSLAMSAGTAPTYACTSRVLLLDELMKVWCVTITPILNTIFTTNLQKIIDEQRKNLYLHSFFSKALFLLKADPNEMPFQLLHTGQ